MAGEQAAAAAAFQVALQTASTATEAATAALAEIKRSQGAGLANRPEELELKATSGAKLSEHLKIAPLRCLLPAELRVHVNLLVKDDSNYESVKKAVSEYEVADRRFEPLRAEAGARKPRSPEVGPKAPPQESPGGPASHIGDVFKWDINDLETWLFDWGALT